MQQCNLYLLSLLIALSISIFLRSTLVEASDGKPKTEEADPSEVAKCVEYTLTQREQVGKGDRPAELQNLLCQRPIAWRKNAKEAKQHGKGGPPKHTKAQKDYIQKYMKCKGKECHKAVEENAGKRPKRQTPQRVQRKEYRCMTDAERTRYHGCVKAAMAALIDGKPKYQLLAEYHTYAAAPGAHGGHSFLAWHREYLKTYELMLQEHDPLCFLPYFDSTLDEIIPVPKDSILWTTNFMGTSNGLVTSGPFANWPTPASDSDCSGTQKILCRQLDSQAGRYYFYNPSILTYVLGRTKYADFSYCTDSTFEVEHGGVHVGIGGHMSLINTAPDDPMFYMHHCFIDYMWEQFRQKNQAAADRETDYPATCDCSLQCNPQDEMEPMGPTKNIDGLSNSYTNDLYYYQNRPVCNAALTDCVPSSPYLFCDKTSKRCLTKVRAGGSCKGFSGQKICYNSACNKRNVCA